MSDIFDHGCDAFDRYDNGEDEGPGINFDNFPKRLIFKHIEKETDKAYLVVFDNKKVWLPKSQVYLDDDYINNNFIYVKAWLCKKNSLGSYNNILVDGIWIPKSNEQHD